MNAGVLLSRLSGGDVAAPIFVVPRQHGSVLRVPERDGQAAIVRANSEFLSGTGIDLHGVSLQALRTQTRAAVIAAAVAYTGSIVAETTGAEPGDAIAVERSAPLIVTGHQPELFHAGVWAKNFAAAGLARQVRGLALNLIVDNDTVASTRISVPIGTRETPAIEWTPFDATQLEQPWEEAAISDAACFRSFGERLRSRIRQCWNYEPLVAAGWPAAVRHAGVSPRLCDCLTAARVSVERAHGVCNLEVPMSRVCATPPFCLFTAFLLAHLPVFNSLYNDAVRGYRRVHRLRSSTHPVPELETTDGWFEAPFWVWRRGDQRRDRPFVRQVGAELELRDGRGVFARLPLSPDRPLDAAAAVLVGLDRQGIRFRTRALTTTLFARLFLADLFIHGIGGAKYDAMTDEICERFLGIKPPAFATVSATFHLPLGSAFPVSADDLHRAEHRIRDLRYNPDRNLAELIDPNSRGLIDEKRRLIDGLTGRHPTRLEHCRVAEINAALFAGLGNLGPTLQSESKKLGRQLRANSVLQNREFSWCLQPEEVVTSFFRREFLS